MFCSEVRQFIRSGVASNFELMGGGVKIVHDVSLFIFFWSFPFALVTRTDGRGWEKELGPHGATYVNVSNVFLVCSRFTNGVRHFQWEFTILNGVLLFIFLFLRVIFYKYFPIEGS